MTKNVKRFFSMLLALSLVFSLVVPAAATETDVHDHAEETKQEAPINMEAVLENITVNAEDMEFEVSLDNYVLLADPDFEPDESDPVIIALETELKNITVLDEGTGESVALTEDQINTVLYLYTQYMDHWKANADVLGVQTPFFLSYNDNEDALGVLGEMLVLAGVTVDQVRSGEYSFQDLQGTVELFLYAHILGVQYYGSAIEAARDEVLGLIEESGAQTEAQKLLVLNDWMAHINTFDMPYIMNSGKENPPMVAEDPQPHELQDEIYDYIYANYEKNLDQTFRQNIRSGLEAEFKRQYYTEFVKNVIYQGALAQAREKVAASIRESEEWQAAYEAEEQKVYDEAYAEYQLNNHEHEVTVTFAWEEVFAEDGTTVTAWKCESAEAKCAVEGCTAVLTAEVDLKDETTEAKCEEDGKTVYTATATVTTTDATGETTTVGEPAVETKEVVIKALGHDFVEGVCSRCEAVETPAHVHEAVVTIAWAEDNTATASVTCGAGCEDTLTVSTPVVSSATTKEATCNAAGETTYTAAVTVKDTAGNAVENVTVNNATNVVATEATGAHVYDMDRTDGACTVCGTVHESHVDALGDGTCDTCYADMPVEHVHSYAWVVTTPASCSAEGIESYKCSDEECGHVSDTRSIEKLSHDLDDGAVLEENGDVAATCTTSGTMTVSCNNCDYYKTVDVDPLGHKYSSEGICGRCGNVCEHLNASTDGSACPDCGCEDPWGMNPASSPSAIPEEITFEAVTLAEDGDDTTGDDTTTEPADPVDPDLDPDADAYAKAAVEAKKEEIEAAADKAVSLDATVEQAVTGGTEDVDTDIEKECWQAAEDYVAQEEVAAALKEDPAAFVDSVEEFKQEAPVSDGNGGYATDENGNIVMMPLNEQAHMGWDAFWSDVEAGEPLNIPATNEDGSPVLDADGNQVYVQMTLDEIVETQMDTPQKDDMLMKLDENGNPILDEEGNPTYMTPNEAIPVYADMAASQMTPGVINYWEGSQFGALAMGTSVCLGYTKAFTYLVQCMHPEVYLKDGATDIKNADNWKTAQDLYYNESGELDINQNYVVDAVRVTFDAEVTMFGQTEDNFNSDHFWNAVKVDGEW